MAQAVAVAPEFAFLFHVYRDQMLALRLISQLRQFYPEIEILCIADGVNDTEFGAIAQIHQVQYAIGEHLKKSSAGGKWCIRMFRHFLDNSSATYLIKLDPDAFMHRPFRSIPAHLDLFGAVQNDQGLSIVRGGCMGMRRSAIEAILNSGLLESEKYKFSQIYGYRRFNYFRHPHEPINNQMIACCDRILADVAQHLNLRIGHWSEVNIQFREKPPPNLDLQWAVTHPHLS